MGKTKNNVTKSQIASFVSSKPSLTSLNIVESLREMSPIKPWLKGKKTVDESLREKYLKKMRRCPKCRKYNRPDASECWKCGAKLDE